MDGVFDDGYFLTGEKDLNRSKRRVILYFLPLFATCHPMFNQCLRMDGTKVQ
jgi:hypothetical protein